jgi:hypothetical protein
MDRSEIKQRLGIDGTATVHAPDNSQPVVVNYTYERPPLSRPMKQTISELSAELRPGQYLSPSQGDPPDSRTDRSSVTDDEGPTNQSAPGGYQSADSRPPGVTSELHFLPWSIPTYGCALTFNNRLSLIKYSVT